MESVIYKYLVHPRFDVELPEDAKVLTVQLQGDEAYMWVLLNLDAPKVKRTFYAHPTGRPFDATYLNYIGTFQLGGLVFHLFEATL